MAKGLSESHVRAAVEVLLSFIDRFADPDAGLAADELPSRSLRKAVTDLLSGRQSNSVVTGCLFLTFYKLVHPDYDFNSLPVGYRGQHGDKLLGAELKHRYITLGQVTAWGENIGAKGDQGNFNLRTDNRFGAFITAVSKADPGDIERTAVYMASLFAKSRTIPAVLPALSADTLSFVRAKALFQSLAEAESGGSIQQFLVAALLKVMRAKQGIIVKTHNFNAADKFDNTAGDVEEFIDGTLLRAYEVTMRPDWKNRLPDFRDKMDRVGLQKYIIIASAVNSDKSLCEPAAMALTLESVQRDIAVVDIMDFLTWMAAELSASELQEAIQEVYVLLQHPKLGGKQAHIETYAAVVGNWLDSVAEAAHGG